MKMNNKMNVQIITVIVLLTITAFAIDEKLVDYYVDLITNETEKALNYQLPEDASQFKPNSDQLKHFGRYDFIIIGSGSAGCVIARRLSEVRKWKILVLEAGTYENDFVDIPAMSSYAQKSKYNWNFITIPQTTACLGKINRQCGYPRGKGVGGTSLLNSLAYARGNAIDFNKWSSEGNPGWGYENVLPYFKKSENANIDNADQGYHGKGGPLNVEYSREYSPEFYAFIDANVELGRPVLDYNGRTQLGVSKIQRNTLNGSRWSSSRAFLYPVLKRKKIKISTYSYVTRILIDCNKTAYGVEFVSNGTKYHAFANKEVILSAGSISSPQILMLSGVGPKGHLERHKIPVIYDLPVGKTLKDHVGFLGINIISNYSTPVRSVRENVIDYLANAGPFPFATNLQGVGFFQTNLTNIPGYPDVEITVTPSNSSDSIASKISGFTTETANALRGDVRTTFKMAMSVTHPESEGTVELKSNDPFVYPFIDSRLLSDNKGNDIETLYQAIQLVMRMLDTKAFRKINATLARGIHPSCSSHGYLSKYFWYCTIRYISDNFSHPVATCKMGPNSTESVVDAKLKVYGIKRLRVADASIIPFPLSGHTNAAAMMIGERVSDFLKDDYL